MSALTRENVVDANDAVATELAVDVLRGLAHSFGCRLCDAGRRDLVALAFVFCIVVEKFSAFEGYFRDGEADDFAVAATETAAGDFRADELALDHDFVAFVHCLVNGGHHVVEGFHLADAEGTTACIGFDETGQTDALDDFGGRGEVFATAHHEAVADMDTGQRTQVIVERKLIESEGFDENTAGAVGEADEIEVALQDAVLARRTVDGDVGEIEPVALSVDFVREITKVDGILFFAV